MTDSSQPSRLDDDQYLIDSGYKPQLHRRLSPFASFAITFSVMSVMLGVFAVYSFTLQTAGPFGIWSWPIVVCGQLLIAVIFAEMAANIPLAGSIYNWNSRLGGSIWGWQAGWLIVFSYSVGGVAVVVALMTPLQTLLGITFSPIQIQVLGVLIILLQTGINIYGVRLAGFINRLAVGLEIAVVILLSIALTIVAALHHGFHPELITHIPTTPKSYLPAFIEGSLLGLLTLIGFESASDVSEETVRARNIAPQSIIRGVAFSGVLGFIFIVILTMIIPNLAQVTTSADPVSTIVSFYLGTFLTKCFLACVVLAMFAASMLCITYVSRLVFAVARDGKIRGSKYLASVSHRGTPTGATLFVAVIEIIILIVAFGQVALYATNAVLTAIVYLVTVINFMRGRNKLKNQGTFSLGKWRPVVIGLSLVWLIFQIAILTIPTAFHLAAYISIAVVVAGFAIQFFFGRKQVPA